MKWINCVDQLPPFAKRVLVCFENGNWYPAKLVRGQMLGLEGKAHFIGDDSRVLVGAVAWCEVVAPGETA